MTFTECLLSDGLTTKTVVRPLCFTKRLREVGRLESYHPRDILGGEGWESPPWNRRMFSEDCGNSDGVGYK